MDKLVVIINGSGGVGKDTVCDAAAAFWKTRNISSITPILRVAESAGWDGVKTPASRRFLSELKQSCTEFNDLPFRYCAEQLAAFRESDEQLMFVHIREPEEIARFREAREGFELLKRLAALAGVQLEHSRGRTHGLQTAMVAAGARVAIPGDGGVADFANDLRNANAILNERRAHALSDVDKKG